MDVGDSVFTRNFSKGDKWLPGRIVERTGPVSFKVELEGEGLIWRRHQDLIRKRHVSEIPYSLVDLELPEDDSKDLEFPERDSKNLSEPEVEPEVVPEVIPTPEVRPTAQLEAPSPEPNEQTSASRYPKRLRKPPERYQAGQTS